MDFFVGQVRVETDLAGMDTPARAFVRSMVDGTAVRTKYFDEYFLGSVNAGIRQVVILASGLGAEPHQTSSARRVDRHGPWPL